MTFETGEVVSRLIAWGLADERAIVEGDLEIRSAARRNRNLRLDRRRGASYLIKEPEPGTHSTLRAEARFYEFCRREPRVAAVVPLLARWHAFHPAETVVVLEVVRDCRSLWDEYRATGAPELPEGPARALGKALALVHTTFRGLDPDAESYLTELTTEPPWILGVHRPAPEILRRLSRAKRRILEIVQDDADIAAGLDAAAAGWRTETVIHGDVRSDNVLVVADGGGNVGVKLIDWELVRRGDPAWDVAGAFHELLLFWLLGMPLAPDLEPAARIAEASWPLSAVQSAVRAFWQEYAATDDHARRPGAKLLRRAVGMAGARLIQAAWEYSREADRLTSLSVLLLQLAANILRDPVAASSDLLGLPVEI
ncbi:MAG: phosphotransferase [Thermoanaerobaculia bacterium]